MKATKKQLLVNYYVESMWDKWCYKEPLSDQEFKEKYNAGQRDFRNKRFIGVDLKDITLNELILEGSQLQAAKNHRQAYWPGAQLSFVNLQNIDLTGVDLREAIFYKANLCGTNLTRAVLKGSNFLEAKMVGANLSCALAEYTIFTKARLQKSNLSKALMTASNLSYTRLEYSNLNQIVLTDAILEGAKLIGGNLSEAILDNTNLSRADLSWANLSFADLSNAALAHTRFWQNNLIGTDFKDTNLSQAQRHGASERGMSVNLDFMEVLTGRYSRKKKQAIAE